MRFVLPTLLTAALALPAAAQPPKPAQGGKPGAADQQAEVERLRQTVADLKAKLDALQGGDRRRPAERKPEPGRGPGERGPDAKVPGFDKLTPEEQATFKNLVAKMGGRGQPEARKPDAPKGSPGDDRGPQKPGGKPGVEERLDRLEKMVQELARGRGGNK